MAARDNNHPLATFQSGQISERLVTRTRVPMEGVPRTSTFVDPTISRAVIAAKAGAIPDDPLAIMREPWYDPLDPAMTRIMDFNIPFSLYQYQGEGLTTLSYQMYKTTTAWWVILMFNGFVHPDEIPAGTELRIPDLASLKAVIERTKSKFGEKFVF